MTKFVRKEETVYNKLFCLWSCPDPMLACKARELVPVVLRSGVVRRAPALIIGNRRVSRATARSCWTMRLAQSECMVEGARTTCSLRNTTATRLLALFRCCRAGRRPTARCEPLDNNQSALLSLVSLLDLNVVTLLTSTLMGNPLIPHRNS